MLPIIQKTLFSIYYPYCGMVSRMLPSITLDGRKLRVLPGVYKPLDSEHHLVDFIAAGKKVLDVGCGSGVITLFAALKSDHVTAVDISPQAIENTRQNCETHNVKNVTVKQSDMYAAVEGELFDYIVSYPPLFEGSFASDDKQWCTSLHFVEDLFGGAAKHLHPDGKLVVLLPQRLLNSPIDLSEKYGLQFESAVPHHNRSLANRIHALPYLHFNMNNHVATFSRAK
ncbi:class I SAM-dependent methyltransferase [Aporhodopirellula aestuarii]|uniref:Class I SAM-dependent methyltransferase n=1 Tax=Aporhodopirellula aestuarii TaxID=2950107 RepID=A0ABT0U7L9_9BACT|nr:methyltransferase [Aporhodopirellula aestuarii]MCM2372942.1 class I SAM-dependent methyltransferase [Aporhodopirellula aestuarii]